MTVLFCLFSVFRFENQRWRRSIAAGRVGSSIGIVFFVNVTAFLAFLFGVGALGLVFWNAGWQIGIGLLIISFAVGIVSSIGFGVLMGGDSFLIQIFATFGLWPLGYSLIREILMSFPL